LLRQRAILRRAFWRKIEIEYEVSLAKELGLQLDPWHHVPYNEWKASRNIKSNNNQFDILRLGAVARISSETVKNMNSDSAEFDPSQLNYRIGLLNNKYTSMSRFEKNIMIQKHSKETIESRLVRMVPTVRMHLNYANQIMYETIKIWRI